MYKIPFSHLLFLCKIDDPLKRAFYESEIIKGCWSYSELERQVNSLYFERTGLSKDKNRLSEIVNQKSIALQPKDIVKNPMTLEFLGLQESNVVMENDLENAILNHLQHFLLELGDGFCYECTKLYKCHKRMEYKTLNTYYVENGCRGMINPVDGMYILCSANKDKADEDIRRFKEYFEIE